MLADHPPLGARRKRAFFRGCVLFKVEFDVKALSARFSDIEKRQIPFALANALNDTAFNVRTGWARQIDTVFDRPVPLTRNAVLFTKATSSSCGTPRCFISISVFASGGAGTRDRTKAP